VATVHVAGPVPIPPLSVVVVAGTMTRARQLERLMEVPGFAVAGVARDPETAERLVSSTRPAAVLLDLDLLNGGLEAIERIMASRPTPIVVCGDAANQAQAAIAAGAVDVVGPLDAPAGTAEFAEALLRHLKMASRVPVITHPRARLRARHSERAERTKEIERAGGHVDRVLEVRPCEARDRHPLVVAIGASTGGPPALATILRDLPADLGAAVVVVQHMAEGFVEGLARWLDDAADLAVTVAKDRDRLVAGTVYLAPAGLNLGLRPGYRVELSSPPSGQYHVPGVDLTFGSVARLCGARSVGVLLTGMGRDGAKGLLSMREAGARTLGQDEASSVVWGMPQAAMALGAVDIELSLADMAAGIVTAVNDCLASQVAAGGAPCPAP
jgi:two-component system, chemotaxis family, protein-glutamate methylesterase/glutaminase